MFRKSITFVLCSAAALASLEDACAGVVVVDPQGMPNGRALLQAALNGAADGDVLLVRAGTYTEMLPTAPVTVSGKGVTLIKDAAVPVFLGHLAISNVPAGSTFVVRGFRFQEGPITVGLGLGIGSIPPMLSVQSSPGTVWIEDCEVRGAPGFLSGGFFPLHSHGAGAIDVRQTGGLTIARTSAYGGAGIGSSVSKQISNGGTALSVDGVDTYVVSSFLEGGSTGSSLTVNAPVGGHGLRAQDSTLTVHGSGLVGGDAFGSNAFPPLAGAGLFLVNDAATLRDDVVVAGTNWIVPGGGHTAITNLGGTVSTSSTPSRDVEVSSPGPVRTGKPFAIFLYGEPGDVVVLFAGLPAAPLASPAFEGAFVFGLSAFVGPIAVGAIGGSGQSILQFPAAPALPAGLDEMTLVIQAAVASGAPTLAGASMFVQVGPNF